MAATDQFSDLHERSDVPPVGGIVGARTFWLVLRPEAWIHRRVESVRFIDIGVVRRRVSVDFTYPTRFPDEPPNPPSASDRRPALVPLTLLRKRRLVNFDLRDELGGSIPHLTAAQNAAVASAALAALAKAILGKAVPAALSTDLDEIASAQPPEAVQAFRRLRESTSKETQRLLSEELFLSFAQELTTNFIVLVPLEDVGRRRIIKFAYDEAATLPTLPESLTWQMGLEPIELLFRTPAAGDGLSYHLEVEAPDELKISTAELSLRDAHGHEWTDQTAGLKRAHMYAGHTVRGAQGLARTELRIRRAGLLRSSVMATAFVTALLLLIRLDLSGLNGHRAALSALIALIPTLATTYIARPREHALVTEMVVGLRVVVLTSGLASFALAVALVLGTNGAKLCRISSICVGVAALTLVIVLVAWHGAGADRQDPEG